MIVIHPKDKTTAMLSVLYEGLEVRLIDQRASNSEVKHLLNHITTSERILLLGHGFDKGLFSGMVVTEMDEALAYGIETIQEELDCENIKLAKHLRFLLDEGIPLIDVPVRMLELDDVHSPLTNFNYNNIFYL